jgi:hypothetical protein
MLPVTDTEAVVLYDNVDSGETEGVTDNDFFPLNVLVTVTVCVTPVGNVVGLAVKVFAVELLTVAVPERLGRVLTVEQPLAVVVLELELLPVIVWVLPTVPV